MQYWDPFEEMERMRKSMQRLFQRFGERMEEETRGFPIDISEDDENLIVKAKLPGFKKEEIAIKATENSIGISAHRKEKKVEKTEKMFRAEKKYGGISRYATLPAPVKLQGIESSFENGLLTIKLKKAKPLKKAKEIKV